MLVGPIFISAGLRPHHGVGRIVFVVHPGRAKRRDPAGARDRFLADGVCWLVVSSGVHPPPPPPSAPPPYRLSFSLSFYIFYFCIQTQCTEACVDQVATWLWSTHGSY